MDPHVKGWILKWSYGHQNFFPKRFLDLFSEKKYVVPKKPVFVAKNHQNGFLRLSKGKYAEKSVFSPYSSEFVGWEHNNRDSKQLLYPFYENKIFTSKTWFLRPKSTKNVIFGGPEGDLGWNWGGMLRDELKNGRMTTKIFFQIGFWICFREKNILCPK